MYGSRRLKAVLKREGILMERRRIRTLMRKLGLWAVRPKRKLARDAVRAKRDKTSVAYASISGGVS